MRKNVNLQETSRKEVQNIERMTYIQCLNLKTSKRFVRMHKKTSFVILSEI